MTFDTSKNSLIQGLRIGEQPSKPNALVYVSGRIWVFWKRPSETGQIPPREKILNCQY